MSLSTVLLDTRKIWKLMTPVGALTVPAMVDDDGVIQVEIPNNILADLLDGSFDQGEIFTAETTDDSGVYSVTLQVLRVESENSDYSVIAFSGSRVDRLSRPNSFSENALLRAAVIPANRITEITDGYICDLSPIGAGLWVPTPQNFFAEREIIYLSAETERATGIRLAAEVRWVGQMSLLDMVDDDTFVDEPRAESGTCLAVRFTDMDDNAAQQLQRCLWEIKGSKR